MKSLKHTTAKASYYNTRAEHYDEFQSHPVTVMEVEL